MIHESNHYFLLSTRNTSYSFRVMETGHLEHLYYGKKIRMPKNVGPQEEGQIVKTGFDAMVEKHAFAPGNTLVYDKEHTSFSLEDMCLEMSSLGKGDIREPFIEMIHADGSMTCDFLFDSFTVSKGKEEFKTLPGSYDESGEVDHLYLVLKDKQYGLLLELHYYVYEECDVITRCARLINNSDENVRLTRIMSMQLDLSVAEYDMTTFTGSWAREMGMQRIPVRSNKVVNSSYTGTSSNRANPFVMLSKEHTDEDYGDCYGFNLIYSGNHYEAAEVNGYGKTRFVSGINPQGFCFIVRPGEDFETPEGVMTYSHEGFNGLSRHMHEFVREHIVRGEWKYKIRPVLLNSWEASYFDINEHKLLKLAKAGKEAGIELFVMDDGWFGVKYPRLTDNCALGDWQVDRNKLPNGIGWLVQQAHKHGIKFGIWIEPEMTNTTSELYEKHPDWVIKAPEREVVKGRGGTQLVLDLANPKVQDFIFDIVDDLLTENPEIDYIKWDANMPISNHGSQYLPKDKQSHMYIEYHRGFAKVCDRIRAKYPDITIQACASGGGRANWGVLPWFDEFWVSDNTDALQRVYMQWGTSYFFPAIAMASHISATPNHTVFRTTSLKYRIDVAMSGRLGMEIQPKNMTEEEKALCRNAITEYKKIRPVVQFGDLYRLVSPYDGRNMASLMYVTPEKSEAVFYWWKLETFYDDHLPRVKMAGLDPEKRYTVYELNRIDNVELPYEGKSYSGRFLMENGLEIPLKHKVDYHKQDDWSSRVLYLKAE